MDFKEILIEWLNKLAREGIVEEEIYENEDTKVEKRCHCSGKYHCNNKYLYDVKPVCTCTMDEECLQSIQNVIKIAKVMKQYDSKAEMVIEFLTDILNVYYNS